jgi:hypothetical protein
VPSPTHPTDGYPPGTWIDCRGNVRVPSQEFHHDDGRIEHGQAAIQAGMRWIDSMQAQRRRVSSAPARVAAPSARQRPRERREQRHTARSTSSGDSGDADEPPGRRGLRPIGDILADTFHWLACPFCTQPLHTDRDGAQHCGGCAISWWEGLR